MLELELDKIERDALTDLERAPMAWRVGRPLYSPGIRSVINKGLAFQSVTLISITDKGREVLQHLGV